MKKRLGMIFMCCVTTALAVAAGRDSRKCGLYLKMQAVYRANLDAYLLDVLDVKELDEELKNSMLGFVSHRRKDQNSYERESSMGLTFIYLRNNLYIEYLGKEQLSLLERQTGAKGSLVTDEIKAMVKSTYPEIIRVRNPWNQDDGGGFLYPAALGRKPVIPNRALVLGIANAMEYDEAGRLLSDLHREEKYEYLDKIKKEKEKEYSEILGTEVYILVE